MEDRPPVHHHVDLDGFILSERDDGRGGVQQYGLDSTLQHEDFAAAQISVEICSCRQTSIRPPIDIPADNGATALGMVVFRYGKRVTRSSARIEVCAKGSFE